MDLDIRKQLIRDISQFSSDTMEYKTKINSYEKLTGRKYPKRGYPGRMMEQNKVIKRSVLTVCFQIEFFF